MSDEAFTAEERAAMKERAAEVRRAKSGKSDGLKDVLDKIAEMSGTDKVIAQRIHEIVTEVAPDLTPKTYYGMPGWAKNGKVLVFLQPAEKFKARYATLGVNDTAMLDDGTMWPTSWAITDMTEAHEKAIADIVRRAVG
jgi:uncharacterized protein YdhG (YjbR/CyaY superfamily)